MNFLKLNTLAYIVIFCLTTIPTSSHSQDAPKNSDMILSKKDAALMFTLQRSEWNSNVEAAYKSGIAKAMGVAERGYGMVTPHPSGFMIVSPDYSSAGYPDFIQVTVAYRSPLAQKMTDAFLEEIILKAKTELAPKFEVIGDVNRLKGGVGIFFTIFKR